MLVGRPPLEAPYLMGHVDVVISVLLPGSQAHTVRENRAGGSEDDTAVRKDETGDGRDKRRTTMLAERVSECAESLEVSTRDKPTVYLLLLDH